MMRVLRDPIGWWEALGRPLRALPRWGALLVLLLGAALLVWSSVSVERMYGEQRAKEAGIAAKDGHFGDIDLYRQINQRVRAGESYYAAALSEQRAHNYPTRPFVTVRLPTLAWTDRLWGESGWRIIAIGALLANIAAWIGALSERGLALERAAAALLIPAAGIGAFYEHVGVVHELIAGLFLSLALGLYRPHRWWPSLIAAAAALAVRELAVPFVLLWAVFAAWKGRRAEFRAVVALLIVFALGMALHALGVAGARMPGDIASPGWTGMLGLPLVLTSIVRLSPLLAVPSSIAGPLALLPLLGWIGLGGRFGLFASLWFIGFGLAVALFARANNFYWVLLMLPAYAVGLALVPRALADLVMAILRPRGMIAKS